MYRQPPSGLEKVDQEVALNFHYEHKQKYDIRSFSVKPGAKVKLILQRNGRRPSSQSHNLHPRKVQGK